MKSYSDDLKVSIKRYRDATKASFRKLSNIFGVSKSSIHRWITGASSRHTKPHVRTGVKEAMLLIIEETLTKKPYTQLKELKELLSRSGLGNPSISSIWRYIKAIGWSHKNLKVNISTENNTPEKKEALRKRIRRIGIKNIICFDEVGFVLGMKPRKGWSPKGSPCVVEMPKTKRVHYTGHFLIGCDGILKWEILEGSSTTSALRSFFKMNSHENDLVKGKTLVLDNLRSHHNNEFKTDLCNLGVTGLWNLPYSPELNPIEEMFGWIKRRLRTQFITTKTQLEKEITALIPEINKNGLKSYYRNSYC